MKKSYEISLVGKLKRWDWVRQKYIVQNSQGTDKSEEKILRVWLKMPHISEYWY